MHSSPRSGVRTRFLRRLIRLLPSVLLLTFLYPDVRPAHADVAIGTSSAGFLGFEIGGRPSGMAGAQVGIGNGVMSQFWNPAFLADLNRPEVGAMHAAWLGDLKYEWLGYARPLGSRLGVGSLSVAYFHMPSINGVDQFDNPTGEFRVYDLAVTAGLSRPITKAVSAGANVKLIHQTLASVSGTGGAVDLGLKATTHSTTFGAAVQNLGPGLSLGGSAYPLPMQVRFGASQGFYGDRVLLAADFNIPRDYYKDVRIGTEVRPYGNVAVRVGYRRELGTSGDPSTGLSFGLGLHVKQLSLDYAMTPNDAFDDVHRLSFGYSFGGGGEEPAPKPKKPEEQPAPPPPPTGPKVIARATPPKAAPATAKASTASTPSQVAAAASPKSVAATQGAATPAAASPAAGSSGAAPKAAAKDIQYQYDVVLGLYPSESSAQSELKALEILGFNLKDARISANSDGSYRLSLARFGSKKSANDLVASLTRMSFQPHVEVVQR